MQIAFTSSSISPFYFFPFLFFLFFYLPTGKVLEKFIYSFFIYIQTD